MNSTLPDNTTLSDNTTNPTSTDDTKDTKETKEVEDTECCICFEENTKTVLYCKHHLCNECLKGMKRSGRTLSCPMCRWTPRDPCNFKLFSDIKHIPKNTPTTMTSGNRVSNNYIIARIYDRNIRLNINRQNQLLYYIQTRIRQPPRTARRCGFCNCEGHTRPKCDRLITIFYQTAEYYNNNNPIIRNHADRYLHYKLRTINPRFKMTASDNKRLQHIIETLH